MRSFPDVLLPLLVLPVLVACGAEDEPGKAATTTAGTTSGKSAPSSSPPSASDSPDATGSPGEEDPGTVLPRPAPGTCEPVPESAEGRYVVADAGEVILRLEDGAVRLDVSSSSGWGTMAASTPIEAVVTFTRGEEELVLEAEREGGRLLIRLCDDA